MSLQADLRLSHEVSVKQSDDLREVDITFFLANEGEVIATATYLWVRFHNVKNIVKCTGSWKDASEINNGIPTVQLTYSAPIVRPIRMHCNNVIVNVDKDIEQIEARVVMGALNMRTKEGTYIIPLEKNKNEI